MKKIILCIIAFLVLLTIGIPLYQRISKEIKWRNFENRVAKFYNGDKIAYDDTFNETAYKWLEYAKRETPKEYEINDMVKDYIKCILKAIDYRINNNDEQFTEYFKNYGLDIVGIHGIRDTFIEYIAKNITDSDIEDYKNKEFTNKLVKKLEKILTHKSDDDFKGWYILNDKDKRIEMPYNVYYDFKHNGKVLKNEIKEIKSIKISKNRPCICHIKYIDNNDNVNNTEMIMVTIGYTNTDKIHYALPSLRELFYANDTNPTLTAGQHDYDEALIKEKEWEAEIGLNGDMSYLNVNGNIDKEEKETEHYLTDEEFEKVFKEINKKYGIE